MGLNLQTMQQARWSSMCMLAVEPHLLVVCRVSDDLVGRVADPVPAVVALLTLLRDVEEPAVTLRTDAALTAAR